MWSMTVNSRAQLMALSSTLNMVVTMCVLLLLLPTLHVHAGPYRRSRTETTDLWDLGEPDTCPPYPNCAPGHTCWVYQHPNNCPVCKCVACAERSCIPRQGELCRWSTTRPGGAPGCGTCHCEPCPAAPTSCQPGCRRVVSHSGCTFCKCPHTEVEVNARQHVNADADERPVQRPEGPGGSRLNPYDP